MFNDQLHLLKAKDENQQLIINIVKQQMRLGSIKVYNHVAMEHSKNINLNFIFMYVNGNNLSQKENHQTKYQDVESQQFFSDWQKGNSFL